MLRETTLVLTTITTQGVTTTQPNVTTSPSEWVTNNALHEAMALHTRNLVDFFYTSATKDDAVAEHLVKDVAAWQNALALTPITALLSQAKDRANKQISHLTYTRVNMSQADRTWDAKKLLQEIQALINLFNQHADATIVTPPL